MQAMTTASRHRRSKTTPPTAAAGMITVVRGKPGVERVDVTGCNIKNGVIVAT